MATFRNILNLLALLICASSLYSQGILTSNGSYFVVQDSGKIVINNGRFISNGNFLPGSGSLIFTGNNATDQATISGNGTLTFYNLLLNKTQNGIQLERNIAITNLLDLISGDSLYLNNFNIDLGATGTIRGESATKYISGLSGGFVQSTQVLNSPVNVNPGNLGLVINSGENLGSTVVRRGHTLQTDGFDIGIARYYDVIPTNNASLQATLRFYYLDHELRSISENLLTSFISQDGGSNWSLSGFTSKNESENYVEVSGFDQLFRHTLASTEDPLPVKFLYIKTALVGKYVEVEWATAQKEGYGEFFIQRSLDGTTFQTIGSIPVSRYSAPVQKYEWIDKAPQAGWNYYRILQLDERRDISYSNVSQISVKSFSSNSLSLFPNPANDIINLRFLADSKSSQLVTILNFQGEKISSQILQIQKGNNDFKLNIQTLPVGIYFIKIEGVNLSGTFMKN